jgi:hypothetical protein
MVFSAKESNTTATNHELKKRKWVNGKQKDMRMSKDMLFSVKESNRTTTPNHELKKGNLFWNIIPHL